MKGVQTAKPIKHVAGDTPKRSGANNADCGFELFDQVGRDYQFLTVRRP
jgi:hypothetical protein